MIIQYLSDLHLEFMRPRYQWDIPDTDANVIVLAGDLGNGMSSVKWAQKQSEILGKNIVMVLGNHEFYYEDINFIEKAKEVTAGSRLHVLNNDVFRFGEYNFVGATLWTDYNLFGRKAESMTAAYDFMSDHFLISNGHETFTPVDALKLHEESYSFLDRSLRELSKVVVVTHHQPWLQGTQPQYRYGDALTAAFCSDLEPLIWETQPLAWIAGHTHFSYNLKLRNTLMVSNQKGYPSEILQFDPEARIEI